jgi:activator of HSP90 ATPase
LSARKSDKTKKKREAGSIRQSIFVEASPEEVYEALTDPKRHSEFTGSPATGAPRVGGVFTAWEGYITGRHIELQKGKKIVQEWSTSEWPEGHPPSRLEFTMTRKEDGTQLTMFQTSVPAEQVEEYRSGWIENYWDPLREYFSRRKTRKPKSAGK